MTGSFMETFLEFCWWLRFAEKPEVSPALLSVSIALGSGIYHSILQPHFSCQPLLLPSDEAVIPLKAKAETVAIFSFESKYLT